MYIPQHTTGLLVTLKFRLWPYQALLYLGKARPDVWRPVAQSTPTLFHPHFLFPPHSLSPPNLLFLLHSLSPLHSIDSPHSPYPPRSWSFHHRSGTSGAGSQPAQRRHFFRIHPMHSSKTTKQTLSNGGNFPAVPLPIPWKNAWWAEMIERNDLAHHAKVTLF